MERREFLKTTAAGTVVGLGGLTGSVGATGQEFPNQDIELIVPWAEGGGTDRTARALANGAEEILDVSVFVTNRTGGSGSVGFNATSMAEPDGHTVGVLTVEIVTIEHLGVAEINHEDVAPVMQYNFDPAALTVREDWEADDLDGFIQYAEENPGEVRVSNSGIGAIWHLSAAGFAQEVGIELEHIGYDGAAPATEAVLGGEVEATTSSGAEVAPQVLDGPLQTLATFGEERLDIMPDVPTLIEEDIDFTMGAWRGLGVPNETPDERVEVLHDTFQEVFESEEFQGFMDENGFGTVYRDTEEFGEFMTDSYEEFGELIDELGLAEDRDG
jgi:tripartite-type tricarboxylate transporter receptor subunit TctC